MKSKKIHLGNVVVINFSRNDEIDVDMNEMGAWIRCLRLFNSHKIINRSDVGQSTQNKLWRQFKD